jgi:methionine synthase II (cobalamin-independent)
MKGALNIMKVFKAECLPVLIGSLPMQDHQQAGKLVLEYTPEIPLWVQLPCFKQEGMISQFLPGMPGLTTNGDKTFINTTSLTYEDEVLEFYEAYMAVCEDQSHLNGSIFTMSSHVAPGLFTLLENLSKPDITPTAVKGQITGPFTFCTGLTDENGKAIFYNDQLRDTAVKLLAMKAGWQTRQLAKSGKPVIIFFDEPALTGFGSSAFISISREEVCRCFEEVFEAVHSEGGLVGVHVCANVDWSLILDSSADIVSFDAYEYFDTFILYSKHIKAFLDSGKILAWGIVPTLNESAVVRENVSSLMDIWNAHTAKLQALGIDQKTLFSQSLITPSCGTGSLSMENAIKVLNLTTTLSGQIRSKA